MEIYNEGLAVELETLADARLGARAAAVKAILSAAARTEAGYAQAIETIRIARIPFVDPLVMSYLAEEMESRLAARCGRPAPRYGLAAGPGQVAASTDQSWMAWSTVGCVPVLAGVVLVAALTVLAL